MTRLCSLKRLIAGLLIMSAMPYDIPARQCSFRGLVEIRARRLADLVVLNSNPLAHIRNTLDLKYVMKSGVLYEAATLDQLWPERKPFGEHYWLNPGASTMDDRSTDYWDRPR